MAADTDTVKGDTAGAASGSAEDRSARFKALQRRLRESSQDNRKEIYEEHRRIQADPRVQKKMERKQLDAEEKLAKLDAEEAGEDFERKRVWDWTVEESQRWANRNRQKKQNVHDSLFADYSHSARKDYERLINNVKPDMEEYNSQKAQYTGNGELTARGDGTIGPAEGLYSDANSLDFVNNKPSKEGMNRLMENLRKQDEARERNRKKRERGQDSDVTYINDKNKKFNNKLTRYYDKYTKEIRDNLERGTAL